MAPGRVLFDVAMSLDGFIAGPNDGVDNPLGDGGDRLHEWQYESVSWRERHGMEGGKADDTSEVFEESKKNIGATLMGRRMFDVGEKPWGGNPPFHTPVFVLTHNARAEVPKEGGTTFTFVTNGVESALEQAKAAAGDEDVAIAGGANIARQYIATGLLDEMQIHLVPVLLGGGVRLFDGLRPDQKALETTRVIESPGVTHLRFRVMK